jgi:broad specificity phosphatase PhoE
MPPRIVLVRHGRSAHVHRDGWIDAAGLDRWRAAYELAAIDPADAPPPALVAEAARATVIAASDAPRALASAERLVGGTRAVVVSPLLRETDLSVPRWVGWRMPLGAWALAIGVEWLLGTARGGRTPQETLDRAAAAAEWLVGLAAEQGSVLAVTHGAFRRLVAARLASLGWRASGGRRSLRNWSAWGLSGPTDTTG